MFRKNVIKPLSIGLILLILFVRSVGPAVVMAEGEDVTPTPTETQETTQVQEEEVTPTESPTPTPTDTSIEVENTGDLNNDIDSTSNTGENTATQSATPTVTPTGEPEIISSETPASTEGTETSENNNSEENINDSSESSPSAEVSTGDAVSITEVENAVNTNVINSKIVNHTINLFVDENGDIDLSDPFSIAEEIVVSDNNSEEVINVLATDATNYAYLSNDVVTISDTGSNTIEGSKEAVINTGDAYSITSLLNQVNFTIVGSVIHVVTINIFGNLTGNIILPEFSSLESCSECGMSIEASNEAVVNNNVDSYANTGENEVEYTESGEIKTGDAVSIVNLANFINTNIFGMLLFNLTINNYGNWAGDFLGWGSVLGQQNGQNGQNGLFLNFISNGGSDGCSNCTGDVTTYNSAYVENNINSLANTGRNSINGENAEINTGNAYSAVTLANFVNSNFINSIGFFGFINIFGNLTGNIGGAGYFLPPASEPEPEAFVESASSNDDSEQVREEGGLLEVFNENNVGEYVNPGDTVTFFIDVKNPGTGKIYETKLYLYLVHNGENVGGTFFDLGGIEAGKTTKVSTGFVLSDDAPYGEYTAVSLAKGYSGEGKEEIISTSESEFKIGEYFAPGLILDDSDNTDGEKILGGVLGTSEAQGAKGFNPAKAYLMGYSVLVFVYLLMRAFNKRAYLEELLGRGISLRRRAYSFRSFLL